MTDLLDGFVAALVVGVLNLVIISALNWSRGASEVAFLSRVYLVPMGPAGNGRER